MPNRPASTASAAKNCAVDIRVGKLLTPAATVRPCDSGCSAPSRSSPTTASHTPWGAGRSAVCWRSCCSKPPASCRSTDCATCCGTTTRPSRRAVPCTSTSPGSGPRCPSAAPTPPASSSSPTATGTCCGSTPTPSTPTASAACSTRPPTPPTWTTVTGYCTTPSPCGAAPPCTTPPSPTGYVGGCAPASTSSASRRSKRRSPPALTSAATASSYPSWPGCAPNTPSGNASSNCTCVLCTGTDVPPKPSTFTTRPGPGWPTRSASTPDPSYNNSTRPSCVATPFPPPRFHRRHRPWPAESHPPSCPPTWRRSRAVSSSSISSTPCYRAAPPRW